MTARRIGKTDIRFDDERMRRLMTHINRLTEELDNLMAALDEGSEGQVLIKRSQRDFDAEWGDAASGGSNETTAENVGTGAGVFRDQSDFQLNFRSLIGGSGIEVVVDGDEVRITATDSADQLEPLMIAGVFG